METEAGPQPRRLCPTPSPAHIGERRRAPRRYHRRPERHGHSADEDGQSRAIEAIITQYELSDPSAVIARVAKGSPHVMVSHLSREAPDLRCQLRVAIHIEWDREIILKSSTLEGWILFL